MMKIAFITSALVAMLGVNTLANAQDHHSVSLGYAHNKLSGDGDSITMKGVNVKYRYEWDNPISLMTSFSYLSGKKDIKDDEGDFLFTDTAKYYSLLVGPAYRFNEYVSAYTLLGANYFRLKAKYDDATSENTNNTSVSYSAGFQINPVDNFVIDISYEGGRPKGFNNKSFNSNGFAIGVGYRF